MITAEPASSDGSADSRISRQADWELDFYSRPILEADGKKRWELLITGSPDRSGRPPFRYERRCPAGEVNSTWLASALRDALDLAQSEGWSPPQRLRCWRSAMRTMVQRAGTELGLEVRPSRRTYALIDWLAQREREVYPAEEGFMAGPLAPSPAPPPTPALPLPEAVRGDAWSWASLPLGSLRDAEDWSLGFHDLLPIPAALAADHPVPGLRLFSRSRALALAGWLGGLEPVRLRVEGCQLVLDAGQDDAWLVTDLEPEAANTTRRELDTAREQVGGLQFIAVQTTPETPRFEGFWMLRDQPEP